MFASAYNNNLSYLFIHRFRAYTKHCDIIQKLSRYFKTDPARNKSRTTTETGFSRIWRRKERLHRGFGNQACSKKTTHWFRRLRYRCHDQNGRHKGRWIGGLWRVSSNLQRRGWYLKHWFYLREKSLSFQIENRVRFVVKQGKNIRVWNFYSSGLSDISEYKQKTSTNNNEWSRFSK